MKRSISKTAANKEIKESNDKLNNLSSRSVDTALLDKQDAASAQTSSATHVSLAVSDITVKVDAALCSTSENRNSLIKVEYNDVILAPDTYPLIEENPLNEPTILMDVLTDEPIILMNDSIDESITLVDVMTNMSSEWNYTFQMLETSPVSSASQCKISLSQTSNKVAVCHNGGNGLCNESPNIDNKTDTEAKKSSREASATTISERNLKEVILNQESKPVGQTNSSLSVELTLSPTAIHSQSDTPYLSEIATKISDYDVLSHQPLDEVSDLPIVWYDPQTSENLCETLPATYITSTKDKKSNEQACSHEHQETKNLKEKSTVIICDENSDVNKSISEQHSNDSFLLTSAEATENFSHATAQNLPLPCPEEMSSNNELIVDVYEIQQKTSPQLMDIERADKSLLCNLPVGQNEGTKIYLVPSLHDNNSQISEIAILLQMKIPTENGDTSNIPFDYSSWQPNAAMMQTNACLPLLNDTTSWYDLFANGKHNNVNDNKILITTLPKDNDDDNRGVINNDNCCLPGQPNFLVNADEATEGGVYYNESLLVFARDDLSSPVFNCVSNIRDKSFASF